jgi:uncharacterized DUF497 family protein
MILKFEGFDWDEGNVSKISKRFELSEVEQFFLGTLFVLPDERHSESELRFLAVGEGPNQKPMFVLR